MLATMTPGARPEGFLRQADAFDDEQPFLAPRPTLALQVADPLDTGVRGGGDQPLRGRD